MSNPYFNASGSPVDGSELTSSTMRTEFAAIAAGFDKLPTLSGNGYKIAYVNASGTAIDVIGNAQAAITFLTTPSSANLAALLSDETGSGAAVFATSPTLTDAVTINSQFSTPYLKFSQAGVVTSSLQATGGNLYIRNQSGNVTAALREGATNPTSYPTLWGSSTGTPAVTGSAGTLVLGGIVTYPVLTLSGSGANSITIANSATNPTIGTTNGSLGLGGGSGVSSLFAGINAGVDYLVIQGQTSLPYIYAAGGSTNINTGISSKGTGSVFFYTNGAAQTQFEVAHVASADNRIVVAGSAGSAQATIAIASSVNTNANLKIQAKGSGTLDLGSAVVLTAQTIGTTVGAAGGASALPATPLGYLTTNINGTACKIPYYTA